MEQRGVEIAIAWQQGLDAQFVLLAGGRLEVEAETGVGAGVGQLVQGRGFEALGPAGVKVQLPGQGVGRAQAGRGLAVGDAAAVVAIGQVVVIHFELHLVVAQATQQLEVAVFPGKLQVGRGAGHVIVLVSAQGSLDAQGVANEILVALAVVS
ncbi:hypothetical protein D3C84_896310 [compost metagenome]